MSRTLLVISVFILTVTFTIAQTPSAWYLDVVNPGDISLAPNTENFTQGETSCQLNLLAPEVPYLLSNDFQVNEGDQYTFSVDVFQEDDRGFLKLYADFRSATGGDIWGEDPVEVESMPGWQTISWSGTVPQGAAVGYILIKFYDQPSFADLAVALVDNCIFEVDGQNLVLNGGFEDWGMVDIIRAYSAGENAIAAVFDGIAPANPADFMLSGTEDITFGTATIDGASEARLFLSDPSAPIVGDMTLDALTYTVTESTYEFYAGVLPIAYLNPANPDGKIDDAKTATFSGIVFANNETHSTWIHDDSGPFNGAMIFSFTLASLLSVGDEIMIAGKRGEYGGNTELYDNLLILVAYTGSEHHPPVVISGSQIASDIPANTHPAEQWEGQLVKIEDARILQFDDEEMVYICSDDDSETTFLMGDEVDHDFLNISPEAGGAYTITGVVNFLFDQYRINPRTTDDVQDASNISSPEVQQIKIYPNPAYSSVNISSLQNIELITLHDLTGRHLITQPVSGQNKITLDISNLRGGIYLINFIVDDQIVGAQRIMVR
jgi:hypothetical protein